IIVRTAAGETMTIDGLGAWPRAADPEWFRRNHGGRIPPGVHRSVVPGAPGSWLAALSQFGTMSFAEVVAPAIRLARDGFVVGALFNRIVSELKSEFARWPQNAALFLPGGRVPEVGSVFRLTELANTLELLVRAERSKGGNREVGIAAARDAFYRGEIAQAIDRFYRAEGGWLSTEDLAAHRTRIEPAVRIDGGGGTLHTCGAWCQGPMLGQVLGLLDSFGLDGMAHNDVAYVHAIVEALKLSFADREHYFGDPDFVSVPLDTLLSPTYLRTRARLIDPERAVPAMPAPGDIEGVKPYRSDAMPKAGVHAPNLDTSFICTVDRHGNMFAATPSDGCFAGPMVPGTGLCPSSRGAQSWTDPAHASVLAPGKRPRLTPSPAFAERDGRVIAFGSPGDDLQPQAMLQVLLNMWRFGMTPQAAVEAPRFASTSFPRTFEPHEYWPGKMVAEGRIAGDVRAGLVSRGHLLEVWENWDWRAGCVCLVERDGTSGLLRGAADPRRPSGAVGN
ncbi:MAG: gamma-glutamyltransferase, partial [Rhodospirillales bacterium]|nr:gamma-glutamyltransferase [Rhodospirillales bacterium]